MNASAFRKILPWLIIAVAFIACASVGCPIRLLFGVSCPGCGMTRAAVSIAKLDFCAAIHYHPAVFTIPVFALFFLIFRKNKKAVYAIFFVICLLLLAVYIYRLLRGISPDVVYFSPGEGLIYKTVRSVFNVNQ